MGSLQEERTESGLEGRDGPDAMSAAAGAGVGVLAGLAVGDEEDVADERVNSVLVWVEVPVRREDEVPGVGYNPPE